jgi:two-component system, NtrC family, sensor histidine kinase PilS
MHPSLRRKLLWLIAARAAIVTVLLGSAVLIEIRSPGALRMNPFLVLIGITYGLTVVYSLALKFTERHRWLVDVQLGCDAVIVSAIVLLTGGVASYASTLYTLPIIAASVIESRRGGVMVGILSAVLFAGLVLMQYTGGGLLPIAGYPLLPQRDALFTVGLNVFGFLGVALLSGSLAEGLRRADEQLAQASNRIADLQVFSQHVIDSLRSGLATTDLEGTILTFNRTAEAIAGIEARDAVGGHAFDVLQLPGDFTGFFGPSERRPRLPRVEYAYTRPDGREIEMGISTAPLVTPPRGETGFLFTFQDVTESRRLEREARVQQRLAAVGEMAAGIAHEIRNPLASMSGSIQILRQELPLTPDQSQLMDIVLRESERLNDTIRSFLAYARPQRAATVTLDVRQVITDTARLLENNAELCDGHAIDVDVPDEEVRYDADEGQIRQIVWNLASNGLRAMPGGGRLRLSVGRHEPGGERQGELVIAVQDDGVGIGSEDLDGIFQPFRGGFSKGSGLGLSIVHRIVSDYGGEVRVTSKPGEGTTVRVALPLGGPQIAVAGARDAGQVPRLRSGQAPRLRSGQAPRLRSGQAGKP